LVTPKETPNLIIEFLIPVGVDKTDLTSLAHALMIAPETAPDDILEKSQVEEATFYYVPCYQGEGKFDCDWADSFGFDRQETYTDYVTKTDSNGRSRSVPVTRYRTVTDWRPASGTGSARFLRVVSAADPQQIPQAVSDMLQETIPFQPIVFNQALMGGLSGLDFAYSPEQGEYALNRMVQEKDAKNFAYKRAQGDHQRDWAIDSIVTFDGPVKAGYLPLAKYVFSYAERYYTIWAEGVRLSTHIKDDMPVDHDRQRKISFGYRPFQFSLLAVGVTFAIALFALSSKFNWTPLLWATFITLGISLTYGLVRSHAISNYSKSLREASLAAKQLEISDSTNPKPDAERRALLEKSRPKPRGFFARTDQDKPLILTMTLVFVFALLISFFIGMGASKTRSSTRYETTTWDQNESSSWDRDESESSSWDPSPTPASTPASSQASSQSSSQASSQPPSQSTSQPSAQASSQATSPPPSQSSGDSSAARQYASTKSPSSNDYLTQSPYVGIPTGPNQAIPVDPRKGPFNWSKLFCPGTPPDYCLTTDGPVNGVVYALISASSSTGSRLDFLARYADGMPNGPKVFYDDRGDMRNVSYFKDGSMFGIQIGFYPSDEQDNQPIFSVSEYKNGVLDGLVMRFDREGNLASATQYRSGRADGEAYEYFPDGSAKSKLTYDQGSPVGRAQNFTQGQVTNAFPQFAQWDLINSISEEVNDMITEVPKIAELR
jgi:hypothetical protein